MSAHMDPADVEAALNVVALPNNGNRFHSGRYSSCPACGEFPHRWNVDAHDAAIEAQAALSVKPGDVITTREQWDGLPVGTVVSCSVPDHFNARIGSPPSEDRWSVLCTHAPWTVVSVPEPDPLDEPETPTERAYSAWMSFTDAVRALDAGQREELWALVAFEQSVRPVLADPRTWER